MKRLLYKTWDILCKFNFTSYAIDYSAHKWIQAQIDKDFAPFINGIQEYDLDEASVLDTIS
nr:hypothetical protein [Candidatus Anoxychlamydiales bacterium]